MEVINGNVSLPAWYNTERETGNTIQRLTDIKELVFYLENPDPFIRRLAIIRTGQLKRRESYALLNGILDDNLETEDNRELAALFMQKLNYELNLGFFTGHRYLSRFTGQEDIDSLIKISVSDTLPDIRFNFGNALIESQLNFDNEFLKSSMDEKHEVLPFSAKDWIRHVSAGLVNDMRKGIKKLLSSVLTFLFIKGPKSILKLLASVPKKLSARKEAAKEYPVPETPKTPKAPKTRPVVYSSQRKKTYRPPLSIILKGWLRGFLNILFAPFRVLFRFKWVILGTAAVMYCLFSFTLPGKSLLFRINPRAYYLNISFLSQTEAYIHDFIRKNDTLANVLGPTSVSPSQKTPEAKEPDKKLVVTAAKGLYLRAEPQSAGEKLTLMKNNTIVEFMGEEKRDAAGGLWYRIRFNETTGWANAQYLKEG